jgi:UDP-N-acetylmuramoyl-L-alanyl-D-glutamate--2,6-diaminopimelate ligase
LRLVELMAGVEWTEMQGGAVDDAEISGLTADSRKVAPGFLFAALPGAAADGRRFIADAKRRGAVAVLAEAGTQLDADTGDLALYTHPNARREYARLAARFYAPQPETVVAVTGTNGKSSTVEFTRQIWTALGRPAATMGTLGLVAPIGGREGGLTTPDPVDLHADLRMLAESGVQNVAIEASSHGLAQYRLDGLELSAVAFTNLTRDHLDYHGTLANYLAAKLRLFSELLPRNGTAVINFDDPYGPEEVAEAARRRGARVLAYGRKGVDLHILEVRPLAHGQALHLNLFGRRMEIELPLIGEFQAMNALAALGLTVASGADRERASTVLSGLAGARGRVELVATLKNGAAVYVDYAHTPDALERVLMALRPHAHGHLAVVFGCGGDRDKGKRPIMGEIATRLSDAAYITDDNPRTEDARLIRQEVMAGAQGGLEIADREEAIFAAVESLRPGDILVVAGKGHERGQIVGHETLPFDDAEVARRAVRETGR